MHVVLGTVTQHVPQFIPLFLMIHAGGFDVDGCTSPSAAVRDCASTSGFHAQSGITSCAIQYSQGCPVASLTGTSRKKNVHCCSRIYFWYQYWFYHSAIGAAFSYRTRPSCTGLAALEVFLASSASSLQLSLAIPMTLIEGLVCAFTIPKRA